MDSFDTDQGANNEQVTDQFSFKVGEREFNAESAAKKISAADEHIARIEKENEAFRQKMLELQEQIKGQTTLDQALKLSVTNTQEAQPAQTQPVLDKGKLKEIVAELYGEEQAVKKQAEQQASRARIEEETLKSTAAQLRAVYGESVDKAIQERGFSLEAAHRMAKDPEQAKILLEALKVKRAPPVASPSSDVNLSSLGQGVRKPMFEATNGRPPSTKQIIDKLLQ